MNDTENLPRPATLLLTARVSDARKMAAYAKALAESGLYAAHGGVVTVDGQPANRLEGWPDGVGAVMINFPSRTAAESFWFSAKYQEELKPLRRGAATMQAAIFEAV
ncbi:MULTISPECIES: DUF1330 domain-containing protein [Sphingosinicellaceae]|uniref:DUF1330 domain-containing protein n=1 Tax=Sphingosinicellaceae TaxID=2820280 RepID=UPI001C1E097A|nr:MULTISPECIES: DUF1330 domain-containing protein [Polymorphobacter]QYE35218.1 DUF1330 domain-containing protein [Polymorphobacter sp. PAMC 29334]UAJ11457.1 DUF1330 domain-containing protein [Polymorphobacter megasporae]